MLTWGIGTAAVLRGVLILLGVELVKEFEPLLLVFSAILLFSSYQLLSVGDDDEDEVRPPPGLPGAQPSTYCTRTREGPCSQHARPPGTRP